MAAITVCSDFGAKKIKSVTLFIFSPSICHEVVGLDAIILVFWMLSFKPVFSLSSFTLIKKRQWPKVTIWVKIKDGLNKILFITCFFPSYLIQKTTASNNSTPKYMFCALATLKGDRQFNNGWGLQYFTYNKRWNN